VLASVLVLAPLAVGIVPAAAALAGARWPQRSPAAAILLWQALGLSWGLAAVGTLAGLGAEPGRHGVTGGALTGASHALTDVTALFSGHGMVAAAKLASLAAGATLLALLCSVLVEASAGVQRARRRQRVLLRLLAHGDPKVPGALVVDHAGAAAYCVPGLRSAIVISAGTLDLLDQAELAAVLAHERAHLRERHDLVLLPFTALLHAFPRSGLARQAHRTVALLVEMLADDYALRHRPARELATALIRVGTVGLVSAPSGALAVAASSEEVAARVSRLLAPPDPLRWPAVVLVCAASAVLVLIPAAALVFSF
jgi:Zn-dependent protease with chaperone function